MDNARYRPEYVTSWALVIGINDYKVAPSLGYARQDAEAIASLAQSEFGFPASNVVALYDDEATRSAITSAFLGFAQGSVEANDRLLVFFAGHGCTRTGRRGEVGYLVPHDGDFADLATLVRWDDLTRNAELIPAKHVIFIMDACYGGLAITRAAPAGSSRFLKSMLQRYARQVLTAGKADETVADSGGPRPGHSVFTGHLLDALFGAAATTDGIISANAVMAHVYDRVAKDPHSNQTPHYGFLDGDGDFIFRYPPDEAVPPNQGEGADILLEVPAEPPTDSDESTIERMKEYLSEPRLRIRLDDLVVAKVKSAAYGLRSEAFPADTPVTIETFADRLISYEAAVSDLLDAVVLLSRWGESEHRPSIGRVIARMGDGVDATSGKTVWVGLQWYPVMLLMYCGGMAAMTGGSYENLAALLLASVADRRSGRSTRPAIGPTADGLLDVDRAEMFKHLPGHERHFVPRSEYLFGRLQPVVEDVLFLGSSYEELLDRFEMLYALTYANLERQESPNHVWGPPGRFAWKHKHGQSPFDALVREAEAAGEAWPPLTAGLYGGSLERFTTTAATYRDEMLARLPWL